MKNETLKIEEGKFYQTRDGDKVRIYALDEGGGSPVHGAVLKGDGWGVTSWSLSGEWWAGSVNRLDIVSEWKEPLDFDWDCLPKWADRFIAMDVIGRWHSFTDKPELFDSYWYGSYNSFIHKNFQPKNYTGDWKDSLFENPKYK